MSKILGSAKKWPTSVGKTQLLKYLTGKRLTQAQAIKAKCCDCMGGFSDGRIDCAMPDCSLYPFMIYNPKRGKSISKGAEIEPTLPSKV